MLEQKSPETQQPVIEQGTLFDKTELEHLKVERRHWEETTVRKAQESVLERDNLVTTSSVPVNRIYTPQDNEALDYSRDIGLSGAYPYTRGAQPTMYSAKPWTMRMFAGYGTAGGYQCALQVSAPAGSDGPLYGVRYAHALRL